MSAKMGLAGAGGGPWANPTACAEGGPRSSPSSSEPMIWTARRSIRCSPAERPLSRRRTSNSSTTRPTSAKSPLFSRATLRL